MGTLSYSYGKRHGYQGEPNTCHWCGDRLRYERVAATDEDRTDPSYKEAGSSYSRPSKNAPKPGYGGNGIFCSIRCGYQWAVRRLQ